MRDALLWATALLFLLAALHTVAVRREVYALAREIGVLEQQVRERQRHADNLALEREEMRSPGALRGRAQEAGIVLVREGAGTR